MTKVKASLFLLIAVGTGLLWSDRADARQQVLLSEPGPLTSPTCDVRDKSSTIESCNALIRRHKQSLFFIEKEIRSEAPSDPDWKRNVLQYGDVQKKLEQAILNKAKIESK